MSSYIPVTGTIIRISRPDSSRNTLGCMLSLTVQSQEYGIVTMMVSPSTYVVDNRQLRVGDQITGFYDSMAPVPLIYPPQYSAVAIAHTGRNLFATLDTFDRGLTNSDDTLRLNLSGSTRVMLPNGQPFTGYLDGKLLLVLYSTTTRSIPAQTTPEMVIVFCEMM